MKHVLSIFAAFAALAASAITTTLEYEDARETLTRAAVSNDLAQAVRSATNTLAQALADGTIEVRAATARSADEADVAGVAGMAYSANGLYGENSERTADEIFTSIDAAASTNDVQLTPIHSQTPTFSEWTFDGTEAGLGYHWEVEWNSGDEMFYLYRVADSDSSQKQFVAAGGESEDETVVYFNSPGGEVTATLTRTYAVIGYVLGSQSDKPLQPQGDYAPATGIQKSALAQSVQASLAKADTALQTAPVTSVNGKTGAVALTADDVEAVPIIGGRMTGNLHIGPQNDDSKRYRLYIHGMSPNGYWRVVDIESYGFGATDENDNRYQVYFPSQAGTLALTSDIPSLSGQTFNFATTQGVMDALKTVIETLGGTVTNAPTTTISQGE